MFEVLLTKLTYDFSAPIVWAERASHTLGTACLVVASVLWICLASCRDYKGRTPMVTANLVFNTIAGIFP